MTVLSSLLLFLPTEADLRHLANRLASLLSPGTVIYLSGSLGAGKTTLARGLIHGLGFNGKVKSPTYALLEPYDIGGQMLFHFDLYRLSAAQELMTIGFLEYFTPTSICLVEWPEKGMPLLPPADLACYIAFHDEGREIKIDALSERGEQIIKIIAN